MTAPIHNLGGLDPLGPAGPAGTVRSVAQPEGKDFKTILLDNLNEVNRLQQEADQKVQSLYRGETQNVAEVFAAINKAGVAFDLLMEIRNKLTDAYNEIQQMRV
ncbi:MAG: flagellar hook-basal body complex protein FliE [Phycisphaerales bacterium]|nr:MAG: flagellar hook-basal body complex protein FliE [Phycisphaerales bacterium]